MEKNDDTPAKDTPVDDISNSAAVKATSAADPNRFIPPFFPDFNERAEALWRDIAEIKAQRAEEERMMEAMKKNEKE